MRKVAIDYTCEQELNNIIKNLEEENNILRKEIADKIIKINKTQQELDTVIKLYEQEIKRDN